MLLGFWMRISYFWKRTEEKKHNNAEGKKNWKETDPNDAQEKDWVHMHIVGRAQWERCSLIA